MALIVPARRAEIISQHVAPIAGYINGDVSDDYVQIASRFGNSTTLYADQVTQLDTTNGLIARLGYGARGSQTWVMDVTKSRTLIKNLQTQSTGAAAIYDVEAYHSGALAIDGTIPFDVDAAAAINAAFAAARTTALIYDVAGAAFGSPSGGGVQVRFNSKAYLISSPINATRLNAVQIISPGGSYIYCGDAFSSGTPLNHGAAVAATNSPMIDMTGSSACYVKNIVPIAQSQFVASPAPTTQPGAGWLIASTEHWNGSIWTEGGLNGTGNTFESCSALGWTRLAGWAVINSVINRWVSCGGQISANSAAAHSLYIGMTTLDTNGVASTSGVLDSPFYPTAASPTTNDIRMCRTEVSAAGHHFDVHEFHDMSRYTAGGTGQSSVTSTIYLYKAAQISLEKGRNSSSGRAIIEIQGDCRGLNVQGTEFYNDAVNNANSDPTYILYNNDLDVSAAQDVTFQDCLLNMALKAGGAVIGGTGQPQFRRLWMSQNRPPSVAALIDLTTNCTYSATQDAITSGYIEADGATITIGSGGNGDLPGGLIIARAGTFTCAGTDDSTKIGTDGVLAAVALKLGSGSLGTSGQIRVGNNVTALMARNALGTQNMALVSTDSSDNAQFGNSTQVTSSGVAASASVNMIVNSAIIASATSTGLSVTGNLSGGHFVGNGTALAVTDFVASGNWGTGFPGNATSVSGRDTACVVRVTAGAAGVGASPTLILTFKTAFTNPPIALVSVHRNGGAGAAAELFWSTTTTTLSITYKTTPTATETHDFYIHLFGR